MMLRILAIVFVYFAITTFTLADEGDWQVVKATEQVTVKVTDRPWHAVKVGDVVANKSWIQTGPRGRAQLVRGTESIIIQPNSMAGIFTRGDIERKTKVIQQIGVLDLEIEKRNQPHTTVVTPYLAAVVKGTNFSVSVANGSAKVAVNRGLVEVTSYQTGQRANVGPGQRASVDTSNGMTVSGVRSAPSITSVSPSTAPVNAVGAVAPVGPAVGSSSPGRAPSAPSIGASSAKGGSRNPDSDQSNTSRTDGDQKGRGGIRGSSGGQSRKDSGGIGDGGSKGGEDGAGNGNGNGNGKTDGLGRGPGEGNAGVGNGNTDGTRTGKADNGNGVGNGEGFGNGGNSGNGNKGNGKGNGGGNGTGNEGNGRGATSGTGNGNGKKD
ncbi:FecR domain-containing protein [Rhizobium sp. SAFR-030]|uniref:FecR domain-containing protein n=1 Tax=Rhizobium sp. SAFR-030 TaxID=3387277 RepID=UPI003F7E1C0D